MLVRIYADRVGAINSACLGMLMPVVLASTSMVYLKVRFRYRRRRVYTLAMHVQASMLHARSNICIPDGCH